jgi:hypothetical protein
MISGRGPIYIALGLALGVIVAYLVGGGASYKPLSAADPCDSRPLAVLGERGVLEGVVLSGLDGAACELQVTREELTAALADEAALEEFAAEHSLDEAQVDAAVRAGLVRAVDDAEAEGLLAAPVASLARGVAENVPVPAVIDAFRAIPGDPSLPEVIAALGELGVGLSDLSDDLERLLDSDLDRLLEDLLRQLGEDASIDPDELDQLIP